MHAKIRCLLTPGMEAWKSFDVMIQLSKTSFMSVHKEFLTRQACEIDRFILTLVYRPVFEASDSVSC